MELLITSLPCISSHLVASSSLIPWLRLLVTNLISSLPRLSSHLVTSEVPHSILSAPRSHISCRLHRFSYLVASATFHISSFSSSPPEYLIQSFCLLVSNLILSPPPRLSSHPVTFEVPHPISSLQSLGGASEVAHHIPSPPESPILSRLL